MNLDGFWSYDPEFSITKESQTCIRSTGEYFLETDSRCFQSDPDEDSTM